MFWSCVVYVHPLFFAVMARLLDMDEARPSSSRLLFIAVVPFSVGHHLVVVLVGYEYGVGDVGLA